MQHTRIWHDDWLAYDLASAHAAEVTSNKPKPLQKLPAELVKSLWNPPKVKCGSWPDATSSLSSSSLHRGTWPYITYPCGRPCQTLAWLWFSQSSLSQPSNSCAKLWSAEAGQVVDPWICVGGRGTYSIPYSMNHVLNSVWGSAGVMMWARPGLQLPAVGGRMPTEHGMHKHRSRLSTGSQRSMNLSDSVLIQCSAGVCLLFFLNQAQSD